MTITAIRFIVGKDNVDKKGDKRMQFLYKLFISEKELLDSLPFMVLFQPVAKNNDKLIKFMRKRLFIRKIKQMFLPIKKNA